MNEKRRFKRVKITGELEGNIIYRADITIRDISLGGACFYTEKRLNPGSNCLMELREKGISMKVRARVVRANLSHTNRCGDDIKPVYEIAVEFENLSGQQQELLQKLIETFS
ncbi:MAG: PilZ domain-containing protein [Nitrospirae bacterium]|nr:MAG: PilZ domain-containing protein [Nitrospirota bacterium]